MQQGGKHKVAIVGKHKVAIVGSGNWGSAIARIVALNVDTPDSPFEREVRMWVFEETLTKPPYEGEKLTETINKYHENPKYLPGIKLPPSVVADPDLRSTVHNATCLVFVLPHQFLGKALGELEGAVAQSASAITLIKGLDFDDKGPVLLSFRIAERLKLPCCALMGANVASQVAQDEPAEATVGCADAAHGELYRRLFNRDSFRVSVVEDVAGVELCGALKNIVALAAGFSDGLGYRDNTKAAFIRIGLLEMRRFAKHFFSPIDDRTYLESCGIADLVTTCYAGRNRKLAEAFVTTGKSFDVLEEEMLNGQKLQGTLTAREVYAVLAQRGLLDQFPMFTLVHRIATGELPPAEITKSLAPVAE